MVRRDLTASQRVETPFPRTDIASGVRESERLPRPYWFMPGRGGRYPRARRGGWVIAPARGGRDGRVA